MGYLVLKMWVSEGCVTMSLCHTVLLYYMYHSHVSRNLPYIRLSKYQINNYHYLLVYISKCVSYTLDIKEGAANTKNVDNDATLFQRLCLLCKKKAIIRLFQCPVWHVFKYFRIRLSIVSLSTLYDHLFKPARSPGISVG